METSQSQYLERALTKYSGLYDIYRDYEIDGAKYPAYGYFFTCSEKFVLTREVNLWSVHGYEHVLFRTEPECTMEMLDEARDVMKSYMEPVLVRKGEKYPEKDHMYSYLTMVFICDRAPSPEVQNAIRRFRYEKDYLFTIRGHAEAHLICVDMETRSIYTNAKAKSLRKLYSSLFDPASAI